MEWLEATPAKANSNASDPLFVGHDAPFIFSMSYGRADGVVSKFWPDIESKLYRHNQRANYASGSRVRQCQP